MKHVTIKDYPNYQIYEDKRIFSKKRNAFIFAKNSIALFNEQGKKIFSIRSLMQQAGFYNPPQIEGVEHKPIKYNPNYQIYNNGMVWSTFQGRWKSFSKGQRGHLSVIIANEHFLIHRLVYEHFIADIPEGYIIHHQDNNPQNNNWTNLKLMNWDEHTRKHKEGNLYNLNRHPTEKTKKKISNTLKKYWINKTQSEVEI